MSFQSNSSLFIGDLPKFCTERDLEQLFGGFGPIFDVKIKRNNTGKTLSYGFVTLSSEAHASKALEKLDGSLFNGRTLRVRWAMYNARSQNPIHIHQVINSIYVRFSTPRFDQFITEEVLRRLFGRYGTVGDVSIKESSFDQRLNRQSGYAFVHFATDANGVKAAFEAVSQIDNQTIDGVTYNVELSKNLLKQFGEKGGSDYSSSESSLSRTNSFSSTNMNASFYNNNNNPLTTRYSSYNMQALSPHQSFNQLPLSNTSNLSGSSTSASPPGQINLLPRTMSNSSMTRQMNFDDSRSPHHNYSVYNSSVSTSPSQAPFSSTSNNLARVDSFNNSIRMMHSSSSPNLMHTTGSPQPPPGTGIAFSSGMNLNQTFNRYNSFSSFPMQQPVDSPTPNLGLSSSHNSGYFYPNAGGYPSQNYSPSYNSQYPINGTPQASFGPYNMSSPSIGQQNPVPPLPQRRRTASNESDDFGEEKVFTINNVDDLQTHLGPSGTPNYSSLQYSASSSVVSPTSSHSFSPNNSFYSYSGVGAPHIEANSMYLQSSYGQLNPGHLHDGPSVGLGQSMGQFSLESPHGSSTNLFSCSGKDLVSKINSTTTTSASSSSPSSSSHLAAIPSVDLSTSPTQFPNHIVNNEDTELDVQTVSIGMKNE